LSRPVRGSCRGVVSPLTGGFPHTFIPLPQRSGATRYNDALGSLVYFRGAADVGVKDQHHLEAISRCSMPYRLPSLPPCLRPSWLAPLAAGARLCWRPFLLASLPAGTPSYFRAFRPAPLSTRDHPCWLPSQVSVLLLARISAAAYCGRRTAPSMPVVPGDASRRQRSSPAAPPPRVASPHPHNRVTHPPCLALPSFQFGSVALGGGTGPKRRPHLSQPGIWNQSAI